MRKGIDGKMIYYGIFAAAIALTFNGTAAAQILPSQMQMLSDGPPPPGTTAGSNGQSNMVGPGPALPSLMSQTSAKPVSAQTAASPIPGVSVPAPGQPGSSTGNRSSSSPPYADADAIQSLPAFQQGLAPANAPHQSDLPNFYEPPEADQPVAPPSVIVEQSGNNGQANGPPPLAPGVSGADFSSALASQLPMTPQEILAYRELQDQVNKAKAEPIGPSPKAGSRSIMMSLSTAQASPVLHLYGGNATSMTFADDTGAPWPIANVVIGNKADYTVDYNAGQNSSNILVISPLTNNADLSNMIVTLQGSASPLVFSLETGDSTIDYRVDVNLEAPGPNASPVAEPTSDLPVTDDTLMQQFVDDVPPPHAIQLTTSSADVQAWSYQGDYFLRTDFDLMGLNTGTGSVDIANSVSGTHVYRISPTPTVTVSNNGGLSIVTIDSPGESMDGMAGGAQPAAFGNFPDESGATSGQ